MAENEKKELYNKIMSAVSRELKKVLNENEKASGKQLLTVTINWSLPIDVEKLTEGDLTKLEEKVATRDKVIYIFVGYNKKDQKAQDVGQTGRTLIARTKEHVRYNDILEGYPDDRRVYCGEVTCERRVDRALLEQVEGAIIQYLYEDNGTTYLSNDNKKESYTRTYNIAKIENKNMNRELKGMLPEKFTPKNED